MYTSIRFEKLQLHSGQDVDNHTISKTTAVYQTDFYLYNESLSKRQTYKSITKSIEIKARGISGGYQDLVNDFTWHLN